MLNAALDYAKIGIPVFPLHTVDAKGRCSCSKSICSNPGKHPRTANGLKNATTNEFMIRKWWQRWPHSNIGIRTGIKFDVLDPDGGDDAYAEAAEYGVDLNGVHSITGGGRHYLFAPTPGVTLRNKRKAFGDWPMQHCDARGEGGYIVAPPSRHRTGRYYEWSAPFDLDALPAKPAKLLEAWQDPINDPRNGTNIADDTDELDEPEVQDGDAQGEVTALYFVRKYTRHILNSPTAGRNDAGLWLAFQLRDNGISQEGAKVYMRQYQQAVAPCRPGIPDYTWEEAERTLESAYSKPARQPLPRRYEHNDTGNSQRFCDTYGNRYRYNHDTNEWLRWDGVRWAIDKQGHVQEDAKHVAIDIHIESLAITNDDAKAAAMRKWALQSGNGKHISETMRLSRSDKRIATRMHRLDRDPHVLAFPNGYYNLATDTIDPATPSALITKVCAAPYARDASHDLWDATLKRFLPNAKERRDLQVALAYCATGRPKEHTFLVQGGSKSGKSTIFNAVVNALADYALSISIDTFTAGKYNDAGRAREDLVAMVGRRLIVASEANQGVRLNAALLKRVTGNDALSMRANYGKQFTTTPIFGMWLLVNDLPKLPADDAAVWERVHVFRFKEYIKPKDRDEALRDRVTDPNVTGSAVLAWLLEGWRILRDELGGKLVLPTTVAETKNYRTAQDLIAQFIGECCTTGDDCRVSASEFKASFRKFLQREGVHEQYSDVRISKALKDRGHEAYKSGGAWYRGIQVLSWALDY